MTVKLSQEQRDQLVGGGECFLHSHTPDQITGLVELVLQEVPGPEPIPPGTYLVPANNLSDVASTATARTNLGLGTAAPANLGHSAGNAVPAGGANGALTIGTNDATALALRTNNSERLRIDSSGNVGIGTSSPARKVDIVTADTVPLQLTGGGATDNCQLRFVGSVSGNSWAIGNNVGTGGVGRNFDFYDLALNTNRLRIDASGNVGIGTFTPSSKLSFGSTVGLDFAVFENAGGANKYGIGMGGAGTGGDPYRTKIYANGVEYLCVNASGHVGIGTSSPTSKLTIQSGNLELKGVVQQVLFNTNTPANNYWIAANISDSVQDGLYIGKGGNGGGIGTAGAQNIIKIDASGNVLVTGSGGLGYGVGSGGTASQPGQNGNNQAKNLTVALNKPCGQITMGNAALAAGASVAFTLTNSHISVNDILIISTQWGVNPLFYSVRAGVSAGSANVILKNEWSTSLSEAVILNFAVVKGAAS